MADEKTTKAANEERQRKEKAFLDAWRAELSKSGRTIELKPFTPSESDSPSEKSQMEVSGEDLPFSKTDIYVLRDQNGAPIAEFIPLPDGRTGIHLAVEFNGKNEAEFKENFMAMLESLPPGSKGIRIFADHPHFQTENGKKQLELEEKYCKEFQATHPNFKFEVSGKKQNAPSWTSPNKEANQNQAENSSEPPAPSNR